MGKTKIQWTEETWNPLTGCTKISPGCQNCYAERVATDLRRRFGEKGRYRNGFQLTLHEDLISKPLGRKTPTVYFVNSMSDLFHGKVPQDFIKRVFETMNKAQQHTFQILTKRADRLALLAPDLNWTPNIWMGVSVESEPYLSRLDYLRQVPAAVRWISAEPLLGPLGAPDLTGINWVVCGGESGTQARPFDLVWARELRDQCAAQGVPYFMKQMGERPMDSSLPIASGQQLHFPDKKGGVIEQWPADLQVRQMPQQLEVVRA